MTDNEKNFTFFLMMVLIASIVVHGVVSVNNSDSIRATIKAEFIKLKPVDTKDYRMKKIK